MISLNIFIVVKKLTQGVIDNAGYSFLTGQAWEWRGQDHVEAISKGVKLGIQLGKKLKLRSEERNTKFEELHILKPGISWRNLHSPTIRHRAYKHLLPRHHST